MTSKQLLAASQMTAKSHSHFLFTIRYNHIDRNQTVLKKCDVKGNRGDTVKIKDEDFYLFFKGTTETLYLYTFICSLKVRGIVSLLKEHRGSRKLHQSQG